MIDRKGRDPDVPYLPAAGVLQLPRRSERDQGVPLRGSASQQLCEYNLTDAQMADILGVHLNTVWDMRRKMGIPGLKERQRARAERV